MKIQSGNEYMCIKDIHNDELFIKGGTICSAVNNFACGCVLYGYNDRSQYVTIPEEYYTEEYFALFDMGGYNEHYHQLHEQTAIAAMQGMLANAHMEDEHGDYKIDIIKSAIIYADALVEELKKKDWQ